MSTIKLIADIRSTSKKWEVEVVDIENAEFFCSICPKRHHLIYRIESDEGTLWICQTCYELIELHIIKEQFEITKRDIQNQVKKLKSAIKSAKRIGVLK